MCVNREAYRKHCYLCVLDHSIHFYSGGFIVLKNRVPDIVVPSLEGFKVNIKADCDILTNG